MLAAARAVLSRRLPQVDEAVTEYLAGTLCDEDDGVQLDPASLSEAVRSYLVQQALYVRVVTA